MMMILKSESVAQSCPTFFDPMNCVACQALSMEFSRQEYWTGLPFPSLGDLPHPGMEPGSPELQADSLPSERQGKLLHKYMGHPCPGGMLVFSVSFQF